MSKIIIHNNSNASDKNVITAVAYAVSMNLGAKQDRIKVCRTIKNTNYSITVHAKPTRGTTHTFEVRDL